jgi:hypothetical protein
VGSLAFFQESLNNRLLPLLLSFNKNTQKFSVDMPRVSGELLSVSALIP